MTQNGEEKQNISYLDMKTKGGVEILKIYGGVLNTNHHTWILMEN